MTTEHIVRSHQEIAKLGAELYELKIKQAMAASDHGKFVAIDVDSGEFEVDEDDFTATFRLRARRPNAEIWLMRAGFRSAYRIGFAQ